MTIRNRIRIAALVLVFGAGIVFVAWQWLGKSPSASASEIVLTTNGEDARVVTWAGARDIARQMLGHDFELPVLESVGDLGLRWVNIGQPVADWPPQYLALGYGVGSQRVEGEVAVTAEFHRTAPVSLPQALSEFRHRDAKVLVLARGDITQYLLLPDDRGAIYLRIVGASDDVDLAGILDALLS
ncbi:MAG: hypothetical protein KC482_17895 [Dehalococcoidia bacterium]|nr:hypothetical protein [Dehalococcoidia bacterium]MCA9855429.1 hypothetical protein [Dehalococcoidia bacterium]